MSTTFLMKRRRSTGRFTARRPSKWVKEIRAREENPPLKTVKAEEFAHEVARVMAKGDRDAAEKIYNAWHDEEQPVRWVQLAVLERIHELVKEKQRTGENMHTSENPELLVVDNPRGRKRRKNRGTSRRARAQRRIRFRGKMYYRINLIQKFGKAKARKIWGRRCRKTCRVRLSAKRISHRAQKRLPAPNGSWQKMVKRYGVMGAVRRRRAGRRSRR